MTFDPQSAATLRWLAGRLALLGWLIWVLGLLAFAAGIYSVYWPRIPADVLERGHTQSSAGGYNTPRATGTYSVNIQLIHYAYTYQGRQYNSWLPCFCLPVGILEDIGHGDVVQVHVLESLPAISVIRAGPDWAIIILLTVLGTIPQGFAWLIRNALTQQATAQAARR